jgi:hypothetical protein
MASVLLGINLLLSIAVTVMSLTHIDELVRVALTHGGSAAIDPAQARAAVKSGLYARAAGNLAVGFGYFLLITRLRAGQRAAWRRVLLLSALGVGGMAYLLWLPYPSVFKAEQVLQLLVLAGIGGCMVLPTTRTFVESQQQGPGTRGWAWAAGIAGVLFVVILVSLVAGRHSTSSRSAPHIDLSRDLNGDLEVCPRTAQPGDSASGDPWDMTYDIRSTALPGVSLVRVTSLTRGATVTGFGEAGVAVEGSRSPTAVPPPGQTAHVSILLSAGATNPLDADLRFYFKRGTQTTTVTVPALSLCSTGGA